MDDDDLLRARLAEVSIDTDRALARTLERGRARRRWRLGAIGLVAMLVLAGLAATALDTGPDDGPLEVTAGADTTPESSTTAPPVRLPRAVPEPGDAAVWTVDPDAVPSSTASTIDVLVTRLGCNGGVTGGVLRPGVTFTADEVVITFTVESDPDLGTCPGNDLVPFEVDLGQALGDRRLVDGSCSAGAEAATTSHCADDSGVRWTPVASGTMPDDPRACQALEGAVTDVANEPDWRQWADYLPWTDGQGCLLRIDVVAERPGPEHCGWEGARVLIVGRPLGTAYTGPADETTYVRDPDGVFDRPELTAGFDPDATLPSTAVDSGYRRGDLQLWHEPGTPGGVWMVAPDHTEYWPAGETPICK